MPNVNPKTIITAALLLFVAASVVYLVVKETGGNPTQNTTEPDRPLAVAGQEAQAAGRSENNTEGLKVVAYYFHGNIRCMTCRVIEAYAKEAIVTGFPEALKDGRLEWRVVNVEEPGNDHYIQDFQLTTRSVVLERLADGRRQDWKNLQRVWELVRGDKEDFLKYIQDETRAYVEAAGK